MNGPVRASFPPNPHVARAQAAQRRALGRSLVALRVSTVLVLVALVTSAMRTVQAVQDARSVATSAVFGGITAVLAVLLLVVVVFERTGAGKLRELP